MGEKKDNIKVQFDKINPINKEIVDLLEWNNQILVFSIRESIITRRTRKFIFNFIEDQGLKNSDWEMEKSSVGFLLTFYQEK